MNKILFFALLGLALLALSAGEEQNEVAEKLEAMELASPNKEMEETNLNNLETMDLADPFALAAKRRRRKQKLQKKKQKAKARRARKQEKKEKKKAEKGKGKGKAKGKGKKKRKGGKGKAKKTKASKKKRRQRKKQKKQKKQKQRKGKGKGKAGKKRTSKGSRTSVEPRTTCNGCLELAKWNKIIKAFRRKGKIDNYIVQTNRAVAHQGVLDGKLAKNDTFQTILHQLQQQGGGNTSQLCCDGVCNGTLAASMQATWAILDKCQANVIAACKNASLEAAKPNETAHQACLTDMDSIGTTINACSRKKNDTESCACWQDETLITKLDGISNCDYKTYQKAVTAQKGACTSAFGACKTAQATAGSLISTCNSDTSTLTNNLNGLTNNKAQVNAVKTAIAAAKTAATGRRMKRAVPTTCAEFIAAIEEVLAMLTSSNYANVDNQVTEIKAWNGSPACTASEISELDDLDTDCDEAIADIDEAVTELQAMIQDLTGSTASDAVIAAATTTPAPGPGPTMAPGNGTATNGTRYY